MHFANFLHMYQPPTQKERWIRRITEESYRKLVRGWLANPRTRLTLNINACLLEFFEQYDAMDVIESLRELARRGQIEFTGSAKYHPFLPLLPESEIRHQIALNEETSRRFFGELWKPVGFFPPEMAYTRNVADVAHQCGFQWIILDELAHPDPDNINRSTVYTIPGLSNFAVFFRDRHISFRILSAEFGLGVFTTQMLYDLLGSRLQRPEYLVCAMDAETFGHHRPGLEQFLFDLYQQRELQPTMVSDLLKLYPHRTAVEPRDSTWALQHRELELHQPFARWQDPNNAIHRLQWELTQLALEQLSRCEQKNKSCGKARKLLDQSIASDQYWWASAQPWWSIEMIERGAKGLLETIQALPVNTEVNTRAETLYRNIIFTAFDWQRSGIVDERAKLADEDVTQRISAELPFIPKEELHSMIARLDHQMRHAADAQEYERASQLRDRIAELRSKESVLTTPTQKRAS